MNREHIPATQDEEAELEAWADRFEEGWTPEELRAMPSRGRPLAVGDERTESVTIRPLPRQLRGLDDLAAKRHQSRSAVIRSAVDRELSTA
ncbi:MAG: ribbon-helix-helix protein, CopG family [Bifidobacteriaceae bacterium]|jgi:hypothetical protein|nr:ribbon-helix-helix protein, CopG family [Bifidobacteriaceae bacterium]